MSRRSRYAVVGLRDCRISILSMALCRERACSFRKNRTQGYIYRTVEKRQKITANAHYPKSAVIQGNGGRQAARPTKHHGGWRKSYHRKHQQPRQKSALLLSHSPEFRTIQLLKKSDFRSFSTTILHSQLSTLHSFNRQLSIVNRQLLKSLAFPFSLQSFPRIHAVLASQRPLVAVVVCIDVEVAAVKREDHAS